MMNAFINLDFNSQAGIVLEVVFNAAKISLTPRKFCDIYIYIYLQTKLAYDDDLQRSANNDFLRGGKTTFILKAL